MALHCHAMQFDKHDAQEVGEYFTIIVYLFYNQ